MRTIIGRRKKNVVRANLLWKELLESFLYAALEVFYPTLYEVVDIDKNPVFLNKELRLPGMRRMQKKEKILDLLANIHLKTGNIVRILLHVEVQEGSTDEPLHVSMHRYACIITLMQKLPFVALIIRTTPQSKSEKLFYEMECFGTRHSFIYPMIFIDQMDEKHLMAMQRNPIALATLCVLRMLKAKKDETKRFFYGRELLTIIKNTGYPVDVCIKLVQFIEGMINLGTRKWLKEFEQGIEDLFQGVKSVPVKTPLLRKVLAKKSYEWGKVEGKRETARLMLARKMKLDVIADLTGLPEEEIRGLLD
jgi:hypothetical protein